MLTFNELVQDVGAWSKANFGDTYTHELPFRWIDDAPHNNPDEADKDVIAGLGSIAPLLGIGEEIGELNEAVIKADSSLITDSIGDVLIYLADWCSRERLPFPVKYDADECDVEEDGIFNALSAAYGQMCHGKLKRSQKIRGMDKDETYQEHMHKAMRQLMSCLQAYVESTFIISDNEKSVDVYLLQVANDTWTNVVSKRSWKEWPRAGVQHG